MAEIDHGQGIRTRYAHAQRFFVQPGDLVRAGQQIGTVGNSGRSTGSHLHFEIRINGIAQNPQKFLGESRVHLLARLH
jgi:murein DD-endopeptidase MepM/ murein hydrolase activator NlpD